MTPILKVRKRHPAFPYSTGTDYTFGQPLRGAHVGMVVEIHLH